MRDSLIFGIVTSIVIISALAIIPIWIWAEKSKNRLIRLVIIGFIYTGMISRTVEDLVKHIVDGKHFWLFFSMYLGLSFFS